MSSIAKKQIVAVTGLMLVVFIIAHLAGNLFIYGGPAVFNAYADVYHKLRPWFYLVEFGLFLVFLVHIWFTALVVWENIHARGDNYKRYDTFTPVGKRSLATKLMPYSGVYVLLFIIWHIMDFTFVDRLGPESYLNGKSYGLYGIVVNAFADPLHSLLYLMAISFMGLHLAHGTQSLVQTMGFNHSKWSPWLMKFSRYFAWVIVVAYSSIPIYVLYFLR